MAGLYHDSNGQTILYFQSFQNRSAHTVDYRYLKHW